MKLYHGSNVEIALPNLSLSRKLIDFGSGFYTTTNHDQAISFAKKVHARLNEKRPTVSVYDFNLQDISDLKVKQFNSPDLEWLDFITNNRLNREFTHDYDIVIGPVANDDVFAALQPYFEGFISAQAAVLDLKVKQLFNQVVFCTQQSLHYLHFVESEVIDD